VLSVSFARSFATLPMACLLLLCSSGAARAEDRVAACADAAERGQELRSARKLVEARPLLVSCAQRECPAAIRDSCTEWLAEIDRQTPSIVVGAKDENGRDVRDVVVTLDGARLPPTATTAAFAVNPGSHSLRCEAPGHAEVTEEIVLRDGERLRVVSVILKSNELRRTDPPPAPAGEQRRGLPAVPIALGVTSIVAFGVFGYFGATGASDYGKLDKSCAPGCAGDQVDDVRTKFVVADVALVAGIVLGVAAAAVWIFDRPAAPRSASR
jgi:hypothetical protein